MSNSRFRTWMAYRKGFTLAKDIYQLSESFPKEERYSLTDQIRRSSRSVCANLGEAYGKRAYPKHFYTKLTDCIAENFETQVWLDFALSYKYVSKSEYFDLRTRSEEVGRLLSYMSANPEKYTTNP
ncbi:MAG: four helix bundle protein [Bacteroidota bacterium]